MSASIAYAGAAATTTARREVVTYDDSATATVVITQDGTTKRCTLPCPTATSPARESSGSRRLRRTGM